MTNLLSGIHKFWFLIPVLFLTVFSACTTDNCLDEVCAPCQSGRLLIQYEDTLGGCDEPFHEAAIITAYNGTNLTATPAFDYNLSDSCIAGFLLQKEFTYILNSSATGTADTIRVLDFEYQSGVPVTECCYCYPILNASVMINGDTIMVDYPDGAYDNNPLIRPMF